MEQINNNLSGAHKAQQKLVEAVKSFQKERPDSLILESLEAEVALLKEKLGWSKHEILSLPCIRRRSYVLLLTENSSQKER